MRGVMKLLSLGFKGQPAIHKPNFSISVSKSDVISAREYFTEMRFKHEAASV